TTTTTALETTTTTVAPTTTTTALETTTTTVAPTTTTTEPVVEPNTEQSSTTTTTAPDRCASSRGTKPNCSGPDDDPVVDPQTDTSVPPADPGAGVSGDGEQAAQPAPVDEPQVLAGEIERPVPADSPAPAGATLPRTGAGIGDEVTLGFALLAGGVALLRLVRRRHPAATQQ
ncbi:MAG: hypothetical protein AB1679_33180, partial [Actinomycetota bacterium]